MMGSKWIVLCLATTALAQLSYGPTVDLGYAIYTGVHNATSRVNSWKGIRYAAPPVGKLRWQPPQPPVANRTTVVAGSFGPYCPQSLPQTTGTGFYPGNEDCLYLNVDAPEDASTGNDGDDDDLLPVVVWIHGGGYGEGSAMQDVVPFINTNNNGLIVVAIQYRLGAFGFASSPEIKSRGVLNAGLLDQKLAFEWVQSHISKFGGDPDRVTIFGESAGAGSVLLHSVAQNGTLGTKLFKNIITASAWVPTQPYFNDPISIQHYYDFSVAAGCPSTGDVFDCLVAKDSLTLQYASNKVSTSPPTPHANWAFIPVTDGTYISAPPSVLLAERRMNGLRALIGANANEGVLIVPATISTQEDLVAWLKSYLFNLSDGNITNILDAYPSSSSPVNPSDPRYETDGYGLGTAVNISQAATGQQQRAYNLYAEASGGCDSQWLASAFTGSGRSAWVYQYTVPFAAHGADIAGYWGPPTDNQGPDFVTAFRKILGNFIMHDNPSIPSYVAIGQSSSGGTDIYHPASAWPRWEQYYPLQIVLNETGGTPYKTLAPNGAQITQFRMPGLRNNITVANAYEWEGGRGKRCEFWKSLSPYVPQ